PSCGTARGSASSLGPLLIGRGSRVCRVGCLPAAFLGQPEPGQGGFSGLRALGGAAVVEPCQDPGGLLPGAQAVGAAGGIHVPARAQVVDDLLHRLGGLVVEELPVDHDHGSEVAGGVALHVLQGDLSVLGDPVVLYTQVLLERGVDLIAAHDRAQRVGAHAHVVFTDWAALVHGVERGDRGDLCGGEAELFGAEGDAVVAHVALFRLHEVQQRKQCRARLGVTGDDLLGVEFQAGTVLPAEDRIGLGGSTHRSTPPITGSMLATAAMTSATVPPSHMAATAWRLV